MPERPGSTRASKTRAAAAGSSSIPATRFNMTKDGGKTIQRFSPWGGDHHDMWIDPRDPDRMIVGNDQGIAISVNRGKTWRGIELPIAQMYHVYVDNEIPYYVYGNRQDGRNPALDSDRGPRAFDRGIERLAALPAGSIPEGASRRTGGIYPPARGRR
ncbi:MAG: hypothetical protein WBC70_05955 [Candidatus Aminicenantales bacterium]